MTNPSGTNQDLIEEISILKHRIRELEQSESKCIRAEEALQKSEEKFLELLEHINDIFYEMDKQGIIQYCSPSVESFLGYSQAEIIGRSISEFLDTEDTFSAIENVQKVMVGHTAPHEYRIRCKTGEIRWIRVYSNPVMKGDQIVSIRGVMSDVTERKQAEKALRDSEKRFRELFDNFSSGVAIYEVKDDGNDFILKDFNKVGNNLDGYRKEDIIGKCIYQVKQDSKEFGLLNVFKRVWKTGIPEHYPTSFYEDGRLKKWFENYVCKLPTGDIVALSDDITDRKKAEEEKRNLEERLRRSEKMKALGQLAGGVAHDLNNVLGVSTIYSELLQNKIPEGDPLRSYADSILSSNAKAAAIIQDLLTLARRGVVSSEVINLNSVVSNFLKTPVFEKMKDHNFRVNFRTEYDKNLLNIKGSPAHLEKTVMNLVSNAAEAISGKGEVVIRTENRYLEKPVHGYDTVKEGEYVILEVSDTGGGISTADIGKIFEPFYAKKTKGRNGTGLGLAIGWGTVKDHDGYIDVQTEIGQGTTFTLYFPVTREEVIAQKQKVPIEQYMGKGESVLVVDDVAEQRDIAATLLTRLGYEVHLVSSGEEAVEYLKGNNVDILVLDMIMAPGIDGLETYKRVLEITSKQKAIIVSGFSETERVNEAQKLGVRAYVKKPYVMEKLGVAVRDELNKM